MQHHQVVVEVTKYNETRRTQIMDGLERLHQWDGVQEFLVTKSETGNNEYLITADTLDEFSVVEDFVDDIYTSVWMSNDGFCEVLITVVYLEEAPVHTAQRDLDDYSLWIANRESPPFTDKSEIP